MAGMGQSFNLPSGMLEALSQYKAALKDAKAELKDLERQARQAAKTGSVSPEMSRRLDVARDRRNMLEEIVAQQKVTRVPGPIGGNSSEARAAVGGGPSLQELFSLKGIMMLPAHIMRRGAAWQQISTAANLKAFREQSKILSGLAGGSDFNAIIETQRNFGNYGGAAQVRALQMQQMIEKRRYFRRAAFIRKIDYLTSGRAWKDLMATRVQLNPFASSKTVSGFYGPAALGSIGVAVGVGAGVGYAVKSIIDHAAESNRAEGESKVGTESMFLEFERSLSLGGIGDIGGQKMIQQARMAGEHANRKRYNERTAPARAFEYLFGRSSNAIKYQDQMIENSLKRQMETNRYGGAVTNLVNEEWIKKNQRTRVRDEMLKELNCVNYALNYLGHRAGSIQSDKYLDFTNFFSFGFMGNDVEDAEQKALEKIKMSNLEKYHKTIKEEQKVWSDKKNTDFALQRIDAHERQRAVTSFEQDRLTRGLTW